MEIAEERKKERKGEKRGKRREKEQLKKGIVHLTILLRQTSAAPTFGEFRGNETREGFTLPPNVTVKM